MAVAVARPVATALRRRPRRPRRPRLQCLAGGLPADVVRAAPVGRDQLLTHWTVALDACERALAAIARARVLNPEEVRRRRLSLQAERRWLATLDGVDHDYGQLRTTIGAAADGPRRAPT